MASRTDAARARGLRASWSGKEHPEDGLPEDLGIAPEEYLTTLIERVRRTPPTIDA
jgi:hypothetical protein